MSNDAMLREEIRHSLRDVRSLVRRYSGLYPNENLTRDLLQAFDQLTLSVLSDPRVEEAKRIVEERCNRLAHAADRFSARDPALIAASRAQAVASIDRLQDAIFELRRASIAAPRIGSLLRRRSL